MHPDEMPVEPDEPEHDPNRKGDRFDTRAAAVLAHWNPHIDATLPAHARANLQDEVAAAIRHEGEIVERLSATNAKLLEALTSAMHALRSYQYHNGSTELAESVDDKCQEVVTKAEGNAE